MAPPHVSRPTPSDVFSWKTLPTVRSRSTTGMSTYSPITELRTQFRNPIDVLSILLIIGGDIVQRAMAQVPESGPAPICFSFGWVSYSLISLVNLLGNGRLIPFPDYPCKVINLGNGYIRENRSWLIGRLMRDNQAFVTKRLNSEQRTRKALRIAIYDRSSHIPRNIFRPIQAATILIQLALASVPLALHRDWSPLLVTATGTALAIATGFLPQWKAEKFSTTHKSNDTIAITAGNGSRDLVVVRCTRPGIDLEHLAAAEGPRGTHPWERWGIFKHIHDRGVQVSTFNGLPVDFWFTRVACILLSLGWLFLLILVAGIQSNTWYVLLIGAIGTLQNAFVAGVRISPEGLPISLLFKEVIHGGEAMDALMDLEIKLENDNVSATRRYDLIRPLLEELLPGNLTEDEAKWWTGERSSYDNKRMESENRGTPRSRWDMDKTIPFAPSFTATEHRDSKTFQQPTANMDSRVVGTTSDANVQRTRSYGRYEERDLEDVIYQIPVGLA